MNFLWLSPKRPNMRRNLRHFELHAKITQLPGLIVILYNLLPRQWWWGRYHLWLRLWLTLLLLLLCHDYKQRHYSIKRKQGLLTFVFPSCYSRVIRGESTCTDSCPVIGIRDRVTVLQRRQAEGIQDRFLRRNPVRSCRARDGQPVVYL